MLNFEKKAGFLEEKIEELKDCSNECGIPIHDEIEIIKNNVNAKKTEKYQRRSVWEKVELARFKERPTALNYIQLIFEEFIEFHGDRQFKDDPSIVGGIALLNEIPITVIAQQKGHTTKENIKRNFGMPHPEGYRKALRLMKQAEKFNRPILCFIDTPGAYCGIGAEERGQGEAIARNLMEMSRLSVPVISIVIGEGGSGGALALGVANKVMMLENAIYSILSPEGFASILWKDAKRAKEAAEVMGITAQDLYAFDIVDEVIPEPLGGAHKNIDFTVGQIKTAIEKGFNHLHSLSKEELIQDRYDKFRKIGSFSEEQTIGQRLVK